ncbi:MAG: hypothetical protein RML36_00805 [Anaerolineae bacterium]|nr:hypothetical protein [Anaerolineae bacterium]MDW8098006.1 hypothetical protein [Anaerolineae bacterium]
MDPQIGRAGFRIAFYVTMVSAALLFFLRPGTAEFVVTALSLLVGLLFGAVIVGIVWITARTGRAGGDSHLPPERR